MDIAHSYRWAATEVKINNGTKCTAQTIMIDLKKEQTKEQSALDVWEAMEL